MKKNWLTDVMVLVSVVVLAGFIIACCGDEEESGAGKGTTTSEKPVAKDVVKVSSIQLFSDYEDNQVAADQKYKGKWIEVNGSILEIGKDMLTDEPNVKLSSGKNDMGFSGVTCTFRSEHSSDLAQMSKGQFVTLRGKCDGAVIQGVDVQLHYCEIAK